MCALIAVSTSSFALSCMVSSRLQRSMSCCAAASVGYVFTNCSPHGSITMKAGPAGSMRYSLLMTYSLLPAVFLCQHHLHCRGSQCVLRVRVNECNKLLN